MGFSGGKDSIVSLELCRMAGVKHEAFYSCPRIEPPEMYRFIRQHYPSVTWLYPNMTMWQGIVKKAPPLITHRWRCDVLKKDPAKSHPLKNHIIGIRAEESTKRAKQPRIAIFYGQTSYKPIFRWPEWAGWEFIKAFSLPYPSLYDDGFGRIGCVVCPYLLGAGEAIAIRRAKSMQRWPGIWKTFEHAVKRWWRKKKNEGLDATKTSRISETADDYWREYLNGFDK